MNKILRSSVSLALLSWLAWKTNWSALGEAFASLRLELWVGAVALFCLTQAISAMRWKILARPLGFKRTLQQYIGFYFIGTYFNLLLPTSVGGDVVRAWYLDGRSGRRLAAFLAVFLDRLSGLLVLLAMACLAVLFSPVALEAWIPWSVWGMTACAVVGLFMLPLLAHWFRLGDRRVQQIKAALAVLRSPRLLAESTGLSLVVQAANVVIVLMVGVALDAQVPASFYWILVPMVSLLTMLPVSLNGMGVREMSTALLLAPYGVSQDTAVTLALLWFAVFAATSLAGGVVYLLGRFPKPAEPADMSVEVSADHGSIDYHPDQGRARQPNTAA